MFKETAPSKMDSANDKIRRNVSQLFARPVIAIEFLAIGIGITASLMYYLIIPNEKTLMRAEVAEAQGRALLKDERIEYLSLRLQYKEEDEKLELERLRADNKKLRLENDRLQLIEKDYEAEDKERFEMAELVVRVGDLEMERDRLKADLARWTNEVIINDKGISQGSSWTSFEGKFIIGLKEVVLEGGGSFSATINTNLPKPGEKRVIVGDTIVFSIGENTFVLSIDSINYVYGSIIFSLYRDRSNSALPLSPVSSLE